MCCARNDKAVINAAPHTFVCAMKRFFISDKTLCILCLSFMLMMANHNVVFADASKELLETQSQKNVTIQQSDQKEGVFPRSGQIGAERLAFEQSPSITQPIQISPTRSQRPVGITLPQPTSKIIELKPLYSIIEPKPLYEGVELEVPGQKRVPQFQSDVRRLAPLRLPSNDKLNLTTQESIILRKSLPTHETNERFKVTKPSYDQFETPQKDVVKSDKVQPDMLNKPQVISHPEMPKRPIAPALPTAPVVQMDKPEVISFEMAQSNSQKRGDDVSKPTPEQSKKDLKQDKLRLLYDQLKGVVDVGNQYDSPILTPDVYLNTLRMSDQYLGIADSGGWPILPLGTVLSPGSRNATVVSLKKRLLMTQDMDEKDSQGDFYDEKVVNAVKRFQSRHGLALTGTVSGVTLEALNVPAITRYRQLKGTAERLVQRSFRFGGRYLVVNIASNMIEAIEEGRVVQRFKAIVGSSDDQTPHLESEITSITLNPTWTVTQKMMQKSILMKLQQNPMMLSRLGLQAYDQKGSQVDPSTIDWNKPEAQKLIVQHPAGGANPLGRIKLNLAQEAKLNQQNPQKKRGKKEKDQPLQMKPEPVFIHDTPSKRLSTQDDRTWASNSVQVIDSRGLSAWILNNPMIYTPRTIQGLITTNTTQELQLPAPIPIKLLYMTGYVTDDGVVHFRGDPYALDVQQKSIKTNE